MFTTKRTNLTVKTNLVQEKNFSIDLVTEDACTSSVQISRWPNEKVLARFPIDPTDNTIVGSIDKDRLVELGDEADYALQALSRALLENLGAKEFIMVSENISLPAFTEPQDSGFARMRQSGRAALMDKTAAILNRYPNLIAEMDERFHLITDVKSLLADTNISERYGAIHDILDNSARFSEGKHDEYKLEDLQGKMARVNNKYVSPFFLMDKANNIAGMVRSLSMKNHFAYLSDEVVNQENLSYEQFPGVNTEEQKKNREVFLLAYLMNRACQALNNKTHLFIIAAGGREALYDQIGWQAFPPKPEELQGWKMMMKLSGPQLLLTEIKGNIKELPLTETENQELQSRLAV